MKNIFKYGIIGLLIIAALYGVSWLISCGVIKLICLCFGWTFKWSIATGIWLIICFVKLMITSSNNSKK